LTLIFSQAKGLSFWWREGHMEKCRSLQLLLIFACGVCAPLAASSGPDDRQITDPKSIVSPSNPAAHPAPIDDLYYTRSTSGAAWSPDGKWIVYQQDRGGDELWDLYAIPSEGARSCITSR
jgi:hypothetical protein